MGAEPADVVGQTFTGTVKSYSRAKGYGFIVSNKVNGDLFAVHKEFPKMAIHRVQDDPSFWLQDQDVTFTVDVSEEGKPLATEIKLLANMGAWRGGKGGGFRDEWDSYASRGKGGYGPSFGGKGNGKAGGGLRLGGKGGNKGGGRPPIEDGTPVLEERIQATMKSYSLDSKWGFANCDPSDGEFGDIFVHLRNLEFAIKDETLREKDVIEFDLEEVSGKYVAKKVTLVPQDPAAFAGQWMKGTVKNFTEGEGGYIGAPRVEGEIWFSVDDCPSLMSEKFVNRKVCFQLRVSNDGSAQATFVNPIRGLNMRESRTRIRQVVDQLCEDGYLDEKAVDQLKDTDATDFLTLIPDLEFYKADNPSSFILAGFSRQRRKICESMGGGDFGYGMDSWGGGKGKGKAGGKGRGPY